MTIGLVCRAIGHRWEWASDAADGIASAMDCTRCGAHRPAVSWDRLPMPTRPAPPMPECKPTAVKRPGPAVNARDIGSALAKALGLPPRTRGFTLRCYVDEVVTVECEYFPDINISAATELARYTVVRTGPAKQEQAPEQPVQHFDDWMRERTEQAHAEYMARHAAGGQSYEYIVDVTDLDSQDREYVIGQAPIGPRPMNQIVREALDRHNQRIR